MDLIRTILTIEKARKQVDPKGMKVRRHLLASAVCISSFVVVTATTAPADESYLKYRRSEVASKILRGLKRPNAEIYPENDDEHERLPAKEEQIEKVSTIDAGKDYQSLYNPLNEEAATDQEPELAIYEADDENSGGGWNSDVVDTIKTVTTYEDVFGRRLRSSVDPAQLTQIHLAMPISPEENVAPPSFPDSITTTKYRELLKLSNAKPNLRGSRK